MRPKTIPFPPIEQNEPSSNNALMKISAFSHEAPFPAMSGPPSHIHRKDNPIPKAKHNPIPIPLHFKEKAKEILDKYVERGTIFPVRTYRLSPPIGIAPWSSLQKTMVLRAGP